MQTDLLPEKKKRSNQRRLLVLYITFFFLCYAMAPAFLSPRSDLFIPEKWYLNIERGLAIILAGWSSFYIAFHRMLHKSPQFQKTSRFGLFFLYLVAPFLIYFMLIISISGFSEIVVEIIGRDTVQVFDILKDPDTKRTMISGRRNYNIKAYCVKSEAFANATISDDFCLSPEDYNDLPDHHKDASFQIKTSPLGIIIKHYKRDEIVSPFLNPQP